MVASTKLRRVPRHRRYIRPLLRHDCTTRWCRTSFSSTRKILFHPHRFDFGLHYIYMRHDAFVSVPHLAARSASRMLREDRKTTPAIMVGGAKRSTLISRCILKFEHIRRKAERFSDCCPSCIRCKYRD